MNVNDNFYPNQNTNAFCYGVNPLQQQKLPQITSMYTPEESAEATKRHSDGRNSLIVTPEELFDAKCNHVNPHCQEPGQPLYTFKDLGTDSRGRGVKQCTQCGQIFTILEDEELNNENMKEVSKLVIDIIQNIKLRWLNPPREIAKCFYETLTQLSKLRDISDIAMNDFKRLKSAIENQQNDYRQVNTGYNPLYNNMGNIVSSFMPPVYQQVQPAFQQSTNNNNGYPQQQPNNGYVNNNGYPQQQNPNNGYVNNNGYPQQQPNNGYVNNNGYPQQQNSNPFQQSTNNGNGYPQQQPNNGYVNNNGYPQQMNNGNGGFPQSFNNLPTPGEVMNSQPQVPSSQPKKTETVTTAKI